MKKLFCGISVIVCTFFVFSCGSTVTPVTPAALTNADEDLDTVYKEYDGTLIMDGAESYIVVKGDTLSKITAKKYGSHNLYYFPVIMLASHETTVNDPDLIEPGMKLTIPDLKKNLDNPNARSKIKSYLVDISVVYDKKNKAAAARRLRNLSATL